jgi:hypothetical protein
MMRMTRTALMLVFASFIYGADATVQFLIHTIEEKIPGGYSVMVADINHDGKPDVVGVALRGDEVAWYENPGWQRHVLVKGMRASLWSAAYDLHGDGVPTIALLTEFGMVYAKTQGLVWILDHQGDPRELWKATKIDSTPTAHRLAWADLDGDGKKELVSAPLIGADSVAPNYEGKGPLFYYRAPATADGEWKRFTIFDQLSGVTHHVRVVKWVDGKRDQLLTAGFDGIILHSASGSGDNLKWEHKLLTKGNEEPAPRAGANDVAILHMKGKRMLATIEPWHGNEVVVYTQAKSGEWQRKVLFNELIEGHEICVGDFAGDGRDAIVVADRAGNKTTNPHLFFPIDDNGVEWKHEIIDPQGMSASGCAVADINGDGRPDFVLIGSSTGNLKWYENLGRP